MKISLFVGLPGSGKTTLAKRWLQTELNSILIDDSLDPARLTGLKVDHLLIADPRLSDPEIRESIYLLLYRQYPQAQFYWEFFEINPDQCRQNVSYREGGRVNLDHTMHALTELYTIPPSPKDSKWIDYSNMRVWPVWNSNLDQEMSTFPIRDSFK